MAETDIQAGKPVSIKLSNFTSGSLLDLLEITKHAPKVDSNKMHNLDIHLWDAVYDVGVSMEQASQHPHIKKGVQELSRYVMLDVVRIASLFPELRQAGDTIIAIRDMVKNIKSPKKRRYFSGEIKRLMTYYPLTPTASAERYHLWAWDDDNLQEISGILARAKLPQNIISAFAACSLASLGEDILGSYVDDLTEEFEHSQTMIRLYYGRLLSIKTMLDEKIPEKTA